MNLFDSLRHISKPGLTIVQAFIRLSPEAPMSDLALRTSIHKTYTDCYKMQGFIGGQWAYSLNANHPDGVALSNRNVLDSDDKRLALYFLGWESIEVRLPSKIVFLDHCLQHNTASSRCKYDCYLR